MARGVENTGDVAGVTDARRHQASATSLLGPDGGRPAPVPYGREHRLVHDGDLARATGFCARRFNPAVYPPT